ncbi:sugar phosphate isomerase/epimerase, partial [Clostridium perfringens]
HGINLFLENNSNLDPIFKTTDEIQKIFIKNADLEFLLDIANIDNINHLQDLIIIKYPKILHIEDRHFDVIHEHLPI